MEEPSNRERIENLEVAGRVQDERLSGLELSSLTQDERLVSLAHEIDGLEGKLEHRAAIEQAKGVIMHTLGCGGDAAFAVLVARSQSENRKLHDIAEEIAAAQSNVRPGGELHED
jgi:AmiR/NasT family two-component response regulator